MTESEAISSMQSPRALLENKTRDDERIGQVVEVDLYGESTEDREVSPEVSVSPEVRVVRKLVSWKLVDG